MIKVNSIEMTGAHGVVDESLSGNTHEDNLFSTAKLKEVLKPLLASMRILGIIYGEVYRTSMRRERSNTVKPHDNGTGVNFTDTKRHSFELSNGENDQYDSGIIFENSVETLKDKNEAKKTTSDHSVHIAIPSSLERHDDRFQADVVQHKRGSKSFWKSVLGLFLSIIVVTSSCSWMTYSVFMIMVAENVMEIMRRFVISLWFALCLFQVVITLFVTSYRCKVQLKSRFDKFVEAINMVQMRSISQLKKCIRKLVIIAWILVIFNTMIIITAFYYPDLKIRTDCRAIFFSSCLWAQNNTDTLTAIYTVGHYFISGSWAIPTCFYVCLCTVVVACFDDLFERTSSAILNKRKIDITAIRQEYVKLCHLLAALNDLLSPLGIFIFAIYIPLICLNINICIQTFDADSVINRVGYIFWIISNALLLLVTSISGAQVNNAVGLTNERTNERTNEWKN